MLKRWNFLKTGFYEGIKVVTFLALYPGVNSPRRWSHEISEAWPGVSAAEQVAWETYTAKTSKADEEREAAQRDADYRVMDMKRSLRREVFEASGHDAIYAP